MLDTAHLDFSELNTAQQTLLFNDILPAAKAWIESALLVVPVAEALRAPRRCTSSYTGFDPPVCAAAEALRCGVSPDGGSAWGPEVPSSLLDELCAADRPRGPPRPPARPLVRARIVRAGRAVESARSKKRAGPDLDRRPPPPPPP